MLPSTRTMSSSSQHVFDQYRLFTSWQVVISKFVRGDA
ncbi:unnamed protein product, partial [Rotaria magnacalcarata]